MPGFITDTFAHTLLDEEYGGSTWETDWDFCLYTTLPSSAGTGGVEASGGGYSRLNVVSNFTNFSAASGRQKLNAMAFNFGTPTVSWGDIVGGGQFGGGGSTLYRVFAMSPAVTAVAGTPFIVAAGAFKVMKPVVI